VATVAFHQVTKTYMPGTNAVEDFTLAVEEGERIVLVGPSGCGKSPLLRMLAGLETVSDGEILIDGRVVNNLTPQQRNIAMVFQNYALYPHKTVRDNIAFPLRMLNVVKSERDERVLKAAQLLALETVLETKPGQLSGGQRQRVAMARAIVRDPDVFLMDEPLSNLDAKLRVKIRGEIASLQRRLGTTMLYVTHDQAEAMSLGHRVVVMQHGRIQQVAEPQTLYQRPANVFVADFIGNPGMNFFQSRLLALENGHCLLEFGDRQLSAPYPYDLGQEQLDTLLHHKLLVGIRPEALIPGSGQEGAVVRHIEIDEVEPQGHEMLVYFNVPAPVVHGNINEMPTRQRMAARWPLTSAAKAGDQVDLTIRDGSIHLFDQDGNALKSKG